MSNIREVYSESGDPKAQYSLTPHTTFEQVSDLLDRLMGPSAYHGVYLLNRAAEYCSDQCLIEATRVNGGAFCEGFARACLMLSDMADKLDDALVASYLNSEVQ